MQGPYRLGTLIRVEDVGRTRYIDDALSPMYWSGQMVKYDLPKGVSVCTKLPKLPMKPPHVDNPNPHQISTESVDVRFEAIHIGIKLKDSKSKPTMVRMSCKSNKTVKTRNDNKFIVFEMDGSFEGDEIVFSLEDCDLRGNCILEGSFKLTAKIDVGTGVMICDAVYTSLKATPINFDERSAGSYELSIDKFNVQIDQEIITSLEIPVMSFGSKPAHHLVRGITINATQLAILKALSHATEEITVPRISKQLIGKYRVSDSEMHSILNQMKVNNLVNKNVEPIVAGGQEFRPARWSLVEGLAEEIQALE